MAPSSELPAPEDTVSPFWKRVLLFNLSPATSNVIVAVTPDLHVSESRPDPSLNFVSHVLLSLLYFPTCVAFFVFVMYAWSVRPKIEDFSVQPSSSFAPPMVAITVNCSNPPWCGNMSLLVNYSSPSTFKLYEAAAGSSLLGPIEVPLRSVGPQIFNTISSIPFLQISGVIAEFSGINPGLNASAAPNHPLPERAAYGIVTISSVSQLGAGDGSGGVSSSPSSSVLPIRVVTVDTWQVKTAVIGQTVTIDKVEGGSASSSTYPMGIQYEGKRPTWRGTCVIALSTFANVRTLTRSSTLTVIASLGTSSYGSVMVLMAFVWVIPVLRLLLPSPQLVMIKKENDAVQLSGKEKNVHQL